MPKTDEAHKWILIDIVQNTYSDTSNRIVSSDQYMPRIFDIGEKYFWNEQMHKKTLENMNKALVN